MNKRSFRLLGLPLAVVLTYFFLYLPIFVLVIFSFNDSDSGFAWKGFTTQWYRELWNSAEIWNALYNSVMVAISSVVLSLVMSVLLVFYGRNFVGNFIRFFYLNVAVPEVVLAVGLLSLFYITAIQLSVTTLIACHTVLGLGYVVPIVYGKFCELDKHIMEASLDLGATENQSFYLIILPLLAPALITAGLLVFIISFDDFLLSFFCAGPGVQTLPLYIFSVIRTGASPVIGALSTVLLVISSLLVFVFLSLQIKKGEEV